MKWSEQEGGQGRTANVNFLQHALRVLRESLSVKTVQNYQVRLVQDHHNFITNFSKFTDYEHIELIYEQINEANGLVEVIVQTKGHSFTISIRYIL